MSEIDISDLPAPKPEEIDISDLPAPEPEKEKIPRTGLRGQIRAAQERGPRGLPSYEQDLSLGERYAATGRATAAQLGQIGTGLGELVPGPIGEASARATQKLRKKVEQEAEAYPPAKKIAKAAELGTYAVPIPGLARFISEPAKLATRAKRGAIVGGGFGAAAPTGEEDALSRYGQKLAMAGFGGVIGAPLGALAGKRAAELAHERARSWAKDLGTSGIEEISQISAKLLDDISSLESQIAKISEKLTPETQKKIDALSSEADKKIAQLLQNAEEQAGIFRQQGVAQSEDAAKQVLAAAESNISAAKNRLEIIRTSAQRRDSEARAGLNEIGQEKTLSEIGSPVRQEINNNKEKIVSERKRIDDDLREQQTKIVADNEAKGIFIDEGPEFRSLWERIDRIFDDALRPSIDLMRDPGRRKFWERVRETLKKEKKEISESAAVRAQKAGNPVERSVAEDGTVKYYRTFRPGFQSVDDARRFVGKVYSGKPPEGYEAVAGNEARDLYTLLGRIEDDYVKSVRPELQKNWREKTAQIEAFETKFGDAVLAEEQGIFNVADAQIPSRVLANRSTVEQAIALSDNPAAVERLARDYYRSLFSGKTSEQVSSFLSKPETIDTLSHPALSNLRSQLQQYANKLSRAEAAAKVSARGAGAPVIVGGKRVSVPEAQRISEIEAEKARISAAEPFEARAKERLTAAEKQAESARAAVEKRKSEISRAEREKIEPELKAARDDLAKALRQSRALQNSYDELRNYANIVYKAEDAARRTGTQERTYNYASLISQAKNFLQEGARTGRISSDTLLAESRRLNEIAQMQEKAVSSELLKEELQALGGQIGTLRFRQALRTGMGILGR